MKPVVECYVDAEKLDVSIGFYGPVPDQLDRPARKLSANR